MNASGPYSQQAGATISAYRWRCRLWDMETMCRLMARFFSRSSAEPPGSCGVAQPPLPASAAAAAAGNSPAARQEGPGSSLGEGWAELAGEGSILGEGSVSIAGWSSTGYGFGETGAPRRGLGGASEGSRRGSERGGSGIGGGSGGGAAAAGVLPRGFLPRRLRKVPLARRLRKLLLGLAIFGSGTLGRSPGALPLAWLPSSPPESQQSTSLQTTR